jgi:lipopolysaccharide heptosyltransferase I
MAVAQARIESADHSESRGREVAAQGAALDFLVIRLSSIGDIVHTLPAVAALGETFPASRITWVIETRYASLLDGNPYVHRLVKLDTLGWRKRLGSARTLDEALRGLKELRAVRFDTAIDFQGLIKSALLARLSGARRRVGFEKRWLRERLAGLFYTERVAVAAATGRHAIEENLALVERLGVPRPERFRFALPRSAEAERAVAERLEALGAREFIIINPGGGWIAKRWSPESYAALIRALQGELPILLTGSPEEESLIRQVVGDCNGAHASYFPSSLMEFIALARRARLFVGGDTGPLHLAAAVGTPIVGIYGPTDPARNGPFSAADRVLRARVPVNHTRRARDAQYIAGVSAESVRAAVLERLRESGPEARIGDPRPWAEP